VTRKSNLLLVGVVLSVLLVSCSSSASCVPPDHMDCENADLSGVDLTDAHLSGADLTRVRLEGAHLSGATMPDGSVHD